MAKDDMIRVPIAEIAELVGMPADTPVEELLRKFNEGAAALAAQKEAQAVAAAEAAACAEDRKIVEAAIADGRLSEGRKSVWLNALGSNRAANRELIAVLTPTPGFLRPQSRTVAAAAGNQVAADTELEAIHARVMRQAGVPGVPTPPRPVAASSDPHADIRERQVLDAFGLPTAQMPPPVLLSKGTNVADYTAEQHYNRFLRMLGGRFAASAQPAPQGDSWYLPSPNDTSEYVNGEWRQKNPYREIP